MIRGVAWGISVCCIAAIAWGQGSTAQINGTIHDTSGAAVPDAEVKITQTATGAIRSTPSGPDGSYVLPNLPVGPYLLEVTKPGFTKYVQSGIVLQVNSNPTIDVPLALGSVSEQVLVQADAALVETRSVGVGQVVDSQRVVEMPLNGRNVTELIFLAGMANSAPGTGSISSVRNYPTILISVAGGIPNGVTYVLDGANHNDSYNHLNLPLPFPDALQEFKVETSALPAQYGSHSAAAVNAVTKSGGNQFHGDAFEFLRNYQLNARNFFAPVRDTLKRNQFGGVLGGPIKRDRLFFFLGYQGTLQRSEPAQSIAFVPTPDMLAGDFRTIAGVGCNGRQIPMPANLGFVNNQISASALNPAALTIAKRLPVPTDPCGKVNYGLRSNSDEHLSLTRIDYQINSKHSMFGRSYVALLDQPTTYDGKNALTLNTDASHFRTASLALGETYVIGPTLVNSFRAGANRVDAPKIPDNFGTWRDLGVNASSFLAPTIRLSVTGSGFNIGSGNSIFGLANTGPNYNFADDLSWVKGSHQFGFGANYMFELVNSKTGINATGLATFNGATTGLPLADFMVGMASAWTQGNLGQYYNRLHNFAGYAQDNWKISPRLSISYGVRWEPFITTYSKYGWFAHFDQNLFTQNARSTVFNRAPVGLIFPGDAAWPSGKSIANNRWNLFLPRIGVVWDPKGDGKTSVRLAYGRFSDRLNLLGFTGFAQSPPYGNNITLNNVNLSDPWRAYPGGNPLPIALDPNQTFPLAGGYTTFPLDWKPTMLNQWSLSLQHQVGADWLLTANYVGNNTSHLITAAQLNPAQFLGTGPCVLNGVPQSTCSTTGNINQRRILSLQNPAAGQAYASIGALDDGGTGSYQGLYLSAQKRLSKGTSVLANYTWSHCISDLWNAFPGNNGTSSVTPGDRRNDRSNCASSDQRHVFNLSAVLQSPKFSNRAMRMLASDWQLSPIMKIKSAQFFSVTLGTDRALNAEGGQRPNLVNSDAIYTAKPGVDGWMSASAFGQQAMGTYGNLGANNLRGPGVFQFDLGLARTFVIHEQHSVQLRGEAFNLPNTLNPATPVSALNNANFGKIQSDISGTSGLSPGNQRIIQIALKYVF